MTADERELFDERVAIVAESADEETAHFIAQQSLERYRHACEVQAIARTYREKGGEFVTLHLADIAKHRGQAAADQLRAEALAILGFTNK